jgi:hypothetical protein
MQSTFKFYGGRWIPQHGYPTLVTAVELSDGYYYAEHCFFFPEKVEHTHVITEVQYDRNALPKDFFKIDDLLSSEFDTAKARFENNFFEKDRELHKAIFWSGCNYVFEELERDPICRFHIEGVFKQELRALEVNTRCAELRKHLGKAREMPKFHLRQLFPKS